MGKFSKWGFLSLYVEICLAGLCGAFSFVLLGNLFLVAALVEIIAGTYLSFIKPKGYEQD